MTISPDFRLLIPSDLHAHSNSNLQNTLLELSHLVIVDGEVLLHIRGVMLTVLLDLLGLIPLGCHWSMRKRARRFSLSRLLCLLRLHLHDYWGLSTRILFSPWNPQLLILVVSKIELLNLLLFLQVFVLAVVLLPKADAGLKALN